MAQHMDNVNEAVLESWLVRRLMLSNRPLRAFFPL